jgi:hypothetical protein
MAGVEHVLFVLDNHLMGLSLKSRPDENGKLIFKDANAGEAFEVTAWLSGLFHRVKKGDKDLCDAIEEIKALHDEAEEGLSKHAYKQVLNALKEG